MTIINVITTSAENLRQPKRPIKKEKTIGVFSFLLLKGLHSYYFMIYLLIIYISNLADKYRHNTVEFSF